MTKDRNLSTFFNMLSVTGSSLHASEISIGPTRLACIFTSVDAKSLVAMRPSKDEAAVNRSCYSGISIADAKDNFMLILAPGRQRAL